MRRLRPLAVTCVLVAAIVAPASTAHAEEAASITGVGWWSDRPGASAPEGGATVGALPGGTPTAVAAVRVSVGADTVTNASLILQESGGVGQSNGQLKVCKTTNDWQSGKGAMSAAPKPDCSAAEVALERNAATSTWAGDVTALFGSASSGSTLSLMVVPGAGTIPVGFEVSFQPPQMQSEGTFTESEFEIGSGDDEFANTGPSGDSTDTGSSTTGFDDSDLSDFSTPSSDIYPSVPSSDMAVVTGDPNASAAQITPTAGEGENQQAAGLPTRAGPDDAPNGRPIRQAVFFVVVAAVVGVCAGLGRSRWRGLQTA